MIKNLKSDEDRGSLMDFLGSLPIWSTHRRRMKNILKAAALDNKLISVGLNDEPRVPLNSWAMLKNSSLNADELSITLCDWGRKNQFLGQLIDSEVKPARYGRLVGEEELALILSDDEHSNEAIKTYLRSKNKPAHLKLQEEIPGKKIGDYLLWSTPATDELDHCVNFTRDMHEPVNFFDLFDRLALGYSYNPSHVYYLLEYTFDEGQMHIPTVAEAMSDEPENWNHLFRPADRNEIISGFTNPAEDHKKPIGEKKRLREWIHKPVYVEDLTRVWNPLAY